MVDGLRLNDAVYDTASIGTEFVLDVDLIDRVEVVHDRVLPCTGSNAFFGVINVITKREGISTALRYPAKAQATILTNQGSAMGTLLKTALKCLFPLHIMTATAEAPFTTRNLTTPFRIMASPKTAIPTNMRAYSAGFHTEFCPPGAFASREKEIPTASFGTVFGDSHNDTLDEQGYISSCTNTILKIF